MANIQINGLDAVSLPINRASPLAIDQFDGTSIYTSGKITLQQVVDEARTDVAEVSIKAGTYAEVLGGGVVDYSKGWHYADGTEGSFGFDVGASGKAFVANATDASIVVGFSQVFTADTTGISFFGGSTVAQPTGVPISAAGIHAALVSLNLITA